MSFLIPVTYADAAAPVAADPAGTDSEWVFLVGFLVTFYLVIWCPQTKYVKKRKNLLGNLQRGNGIVTSGGIAGKATKAVDDLVAVEVPDNIGLKFQKAATAATPPKDTLKAI